MSASTRSEIGSALPPILIVLVLSVCSHLSERMMIVWIFFGPEEGSAGTGTDAGRGTDAALSPGEAIAGGGAAGAVAIGTAAPDPRALCGGALVLGEIGAVFGGS
jgi:hypothetical protein